MDTSVYQSSVSQKRSKVQLMGWVVFISGLLFYGFNYLLRVYPNTMKADLFTHFHVNATGFGLLASFYYFAYAPMQIPVGVSVDKIGPRRSLIGACTVCLMGVFLFSVSQNYSLALLGRFMIGMGTAFAYVTALKLATIWLPRKYFATATGAVTAFGMIAGIITEKFVTYLVQNYGYHTAINFPLYVGILVLVCIVAFVRNKPKADMSQKLTNNDEEASALSFNQLSSYLRKIVSNPQMWIIGLIGALLYMPSTVFLDLWAIPYLQAVYHLTPQESATAVSIMLAGWLISSLVTGYLSDRLGTRKIPLVLATLSSCLICCTILYVPGIHQVLLYALLFVFGIACGPHPLCFTLSKENNTHKIAGTAVAFANFVIMMGGFLFQPIVGKFLDMGWHGTLFHSIRTYTAHDYTMSLSILPIALGLGFMLTLLVKETYQQTTHSVSDDHIKTEHGTGTVENAKY